MPAGWKNGLSKRPMTTNNGRFAQPDFETTTTTSLSRAFPVNLPQKPVIERYRKNSKWRARSNTAMASGPNRWRSAACKSFELQTAYPGRVFRADLHLEKGCCSISVQAPNSCEIARS
jgi:hypothetical protein